MDNPKLTYAFVNSWMLARYTPEQWERHFDYLEQAGIKGIITITSARIHEGHMDVCFYDTDYQDKDDTNVFPGLLENILEQSQRRGFKVFAGLNHTGVSFDKTLESPEIRKAAAENGEFVANEIYTKYKSKYPDALYGWYLPTELCSKYYMRSPDECADFCNGYLDRLNTVSPGMPMLLSPYNAWFFGEPEALEEPLKKSFALTHFRPGDVFCPQDCLGTEIVHWDDSPKFFAVMKRAVDTVDGLRLWSNCENFKADVPKEQLGSIPCKVSRFVEQMKLISDYVSCYATFVYSNFAPDTSGNPYFQKLYCDYVKTGKVAEETVNDNGGVIIGAGDITVWFSGSTYGVMSIRVEKDGQTTEYPASDGKVVLKKEKGSYIASAIDWERSESVKRVEFNIE